MLTVPKIEFGFLTGYSGNPNTLLDRGQEEGWIKWLLSSCQLNNLPEFTSREPVYNSRDHSETFFILFLYASLLEGFCSSAIDD